MLGRMIALMRGFCFSRLSLRVACSNTPFVESNCTILIEPGGKLCLGRRVRFKAGSICYVKTNAFLEIGDYVSIGHHSEISIGGYGSIGERTITGAYVYITDSNHRYDMLDVPICDQGMDVGIVRIGRDCWLGRGAMVLKDACVGDHCVIAAGAIVTRRFSDKLLVGGIPARMIKEIRRGVCSG